MTLTWEEAEVAALDRPEWRRSVAQCIHLDAGWIKVKVKVTYILKFRLIFSCCLSFTRVLCLLYWMIFLLYAKWNWLIVGEEDQTAQDKTIGLPCCLTMGLKRSAMTSHLAWYSSSSCSSYTYASDEGWCSLQQCELVRSIKHAQYVLRIRQVISVNSL